MGGGLVCDDVDVHAAARQFGHDLGGVAQQPDRQRPSLLHGSVEASERVVEVGRALVQVTACDAPLDPLQVDLYAQRRAAAHRDRERLCAAHTAEPGRHDQAAAQVSPEALVRHRRKRLIGSLQNSL